MIWVFKKSPDKSQISYFLLCNYIDLFIPVAILESDRLFNHAQSHQLAGDKGHTIWPGFYIQAVPPVALASPALSRRSWHGQPAAVDRALARSQGLFAASRPCSFAGAGASRALAVVLLEVGSVVGATTPRFQRRDHRPATHHSGVTSWAGSY